MHKFVPGQRVRCINVDNMGNGNHPQMGRVYIIKKYQPRETTTVPMVYLKEFDEYKYYYESRFEPAGMSNEERIAKRMEELNV